MEILISKKDVIWSYLSQFFSVASGILTLPLILNLLTAEEIGLNYLMLSVGSLVMLFDFGFTPQFSRNVSYIFSGAKEIRKNGLDESTSDFKINYRLLAIMIKTAQSLFRRLAIVVLILMTTLGTFYIYNATDGFSSVEHTFLIWNVYSISVFLNIFYSYYTSLLIGSGQIMESRKANVFSKISYIILTFIFLYGGMGLIGVVLANIIAPLINRALSYRYFFRKSLLSEISGFQITKDEKQDLFEKIWHNSKKLGLVFVGSYAINKLSMFLAGLYLSLEEVASYGLMIQLTTLILTISSTLFGIYQPRFSALRVQGKKQLLLKEFASVMNIYYLLFITGSIILLVFGPFILNVLGSNAELPTLSIVLVFLIIIFLEGNHANFASFIITANNIPFVQSSLISGAVIGLFSYISLEFFAYGIWGLILIQGVTQALYSNWKWPHVIFKEFEIDFFNFIKLGFFESYKRLKSI
ncbi:O-unit flippase-like protein [Flagellimonas lutimaris]|uniref:O-unit flippase-like protein n=1 Tax=Flagellimonas lutimaris TaxID=475082 RepID=UPI0039C27861|tara:strand:- start:9252 stop:10658 length:1407 start_codon:yes stop_codon:yes gene_type:complete